MPPITATKIMTSAAPLPNTNHLLRAARVDGCPPLVRTVGLQQFQLRHFLSSVVYRNLEQLAFLCQMRASFPVDTVDTLDGGRWLLTVQGASMKRMSITRKKLRGESMIILNSTPFTPY
jgi:hypothetical protein